MEEKQGYYTTHTLLITSDISSRHICVALTVHVVDITTTKSVTWLSFQFINGIFSRTLTLSLSLCWQWNIQQKTFDSGGTGIIKTILLLKPGHRVHGRFSNRTPYFIPTMLLTMRKVCYGSEEIKPHCSCKFSQSVWSSRGNILTYRPRICVNSFPLDLCYTNLATVQQNRYSRN